MGQKYLYSRGMFISEIPLELLLKDTQREKAVFQRIYEDNSVGYFVAFFPRFDERFHTVTWDFANLYYEEEKAVNRFYK